MKLHIEAKRACKAVGMSASSFCIAIYTCCTWYQGIKLVSAYAQEL